VLAVKEVGGIARIEVHGLETFVGRQRCASPFPKTSKIALTAETVAFTRHRGRMPVPECKVAIAELDEELLGVWWIDFCTAVDGAVKEMAGWRCLFNAFVGQVPRRGQMLGLGRKESRNSPIHC
jgi:hypothetical protein